MKRLNLKPSSKSLKPVKTQATPERATKKKGSVASGSEMDGAKLVTGVGVAGIVASLICLVVFFQSDIPTKIVEANAANAAQLHAKADNKPDLVLGGDQVTGEDPSLDVADSSTGAPGVDGKDGVDGQDGIDSPSIVIAPGAVISSQELAGHLQQMTPEDFTELAESIDMLIASDPTMVNLPGRKSLAEAYAEAESKYPGQIDGTKRLKLVDELNAIDYTYYVAESGDTLLELSNTFGIPLGQLVEINGIHEADYIKAGAILLFPSETVQPE